MQEQGQVVVATAVPLPILYVKLCAGDDGIVTQLPMQALPAITISSPSDRPHPLELEVEKTKYEMARKKMKISCDVKTTSTTTPTDTIQASEDIYIHSAETLPSSPVTRNDEMLPLSVVKYGAVESTNTSLNHEANHDNDEVNLSLQPFHQVTTIIANSIGSPSNFESPPTDSLHWDESQFPPTQDFEPDPPFTVDDNSKPVDDFTCHLCNKRFVHRKNVYAHLRAVHSCEPNPMKSSLVCPLCRMSFIRHLHLRHHFLTLHEIIIPQIDLTFPSIIEFETWRRQVEKETDTLFISKCAARTLSFNQSKKYYKCHRSGLQPNSAANKVTGPSKYPRKLSRKIGATCPAGMEVTEAADGISVTYWPTHVGHDTKESTQPKTTTQSISSKTPSSSGSSSETSGSRMGRRGRARAKSKPPRRNTSYTMLVDKAQDLLELLENGDVEPESRTLISNMIDNVRSVVMKRYKKHNTKTGDS